MDSWINATGIAAVFTALFALRYRRWHSPRVLLLYFGGFFCLEFAANYWFLPPGSFGPEVGFVCLGLTVPVCAASYVVARYERRIEEESKPPHVEVSGDDVPHRSHSPM